MLPRFDTNGSVVKAHIMQVSWSADHRIIDGVEGNGFLYRVRELLEEANFDI